MCDIYVIWVLISMGNYKKLSVWVDSRDLAVEVYKITEKGKFLKDFSFRDQIRRAAVSISSNIAEGDESGFNKMLIRYLYNAKASLAELDTQLSIANRIGYLDEINYELFLSKIEIISKKLRKLIQYRQNL